MDAASIPGKVLRASLILVFLCAYGFGAFMFGVVKARERAREQLSALQNPELVDVVVTARAVEVGQRLSAQDVVVRQLEPQCVPKKGTMQDMEEVLGKEVLEPLHPNDVILRPRIGAPEAE